MKNFICIFALFLSVNIFVPAVYYQVYHGAHDILSSLTDINPQNDPISPIENNSDYCLYNLETQQTDSFDIITFLVGSAACEVPAYYEKEAIKAQMIACHSYYLYCRKNGLPDDDLNLSYNESKMQKFASKEKLKDFWGSGFDQNYEKFLIKTENIMIHI